MRLKVWLILLVAAIALVGAMLLLFPDNAVVSRIGSLFSDSQPQQGAPDAESSTPRVPRKASPAPIPAAAGKRIALVVGQGDYRRPDLKLKNPVNDGRLVAGVLRALQFEVILLENATLNQLQQALARLREQTNPNSAQVWDARSGASVAVLQGHGSRIDSAAFSPDGTRVLTVSRDNTARLWNAKSGASLAALVGHEGRVGSAAFSPDGTRLVTASWDKTARLWDAKNGASLSVLKGHEAYVDSAAFSPDGMRVVTASGDKTARLWDSRTGANVAVLKGHEAIVVSAVFSADGTRVLTTSVDNTARLWDAKTGASVAVLKGHEHYFTGGAAAFSPDGMRVVTATGDKTAHLWDAKTGVLVAELKGHEAFVVGAAFSPDGTRVVTGSEDNTARVWDAKDGASLAVLKGHGASIASAAFSPDGTRVLTTSVDNTARVWDAKDGASLAVLKGHGASVPSATFSPDGTRLLTTSVDNTVRVWDVRTGHELLSLMQNPDGGKGAAFSPDGSRIVTASSSWAEVVLFYYAGHGVSQQGEDYLIPVDAQLERANALPNEAMPVNRIRTIVADAARFGVILLDASRSTPFSPTRGRALGLRQAQRGLKVNEDMVRRELVTLYAGGVGGFVSDGSDNSPFALAAARHLNSEGDLLRVLGRIGDDVRLSTRGGQSPELRADNVSGVPLCLVTCDAALLGLAAPVDASAPYCDESKWDKKERLALVVAEAAYYGENLRRLTKTARDAELVSSALRDSGFATRVCHNLPLAELRKELENFYSAVSGAVSAWKAAGGDETKKPVAFFYYSGHGASSQVEKANFMIPVESDVARADQLPDLGLRVSGVVDALKELGARPIVVVDACRAALKDSEARDGTKGWVAERRRQGTLIAFSTQPGEIAKDENFYSRALSDFIKEKPGRDARVLFDELAIRVEKDTNGEQQPHNEMSGFGSFQFRP